jgi:four helix bundle protein
LFVEHAAKRSAKTKLMDTHRTQMSHTNFEKLDVYRLSERLAGEVWDVVVAWDEFAKATVGRQIVRAADSIGANIAEGSGRGSHADNKRFVRTARGSLNETQHFLRLAYRRNLLNADQTSRIRPIVEELAPRLNAYLNSIGRFPDPE